MMYLIPLTAFLLSLTACNATDSSFSDMPKVAAAPSNSNSDNQGPKGDKGDKGDPGQALKIGQSVSCSHDYLYSGTVYRLVVKAYLMSSGDINTTCYVIVKSKGEHGSEWTPASQAEKASCSVYLDLGPTSTQNFGYWRFDVANASVTYHNDQDPARDGLSYSYLANECQQN